MAFNLSIPRNNLPSLDLQLQAGEVLFLLGANGTGKSSLIHRFHNAHMPNARRITAHRQTWFNSNAITLSPRQRQDAEKIIHVDDRKPEARWKDTSASNRASIAIYDLVDAENVRARKIAGAVDSDDFALAREMRTTDAPVTIINELFRLSNIPITITIDVNSNVVASKNGSASY